MGLDVVVAPIMKKVNNLVRAGVYALRTNRDFPTIAAIPATPVPNPTAAYAYITPLKIDLNGAPAAAFTLALADGSGGNDKIAVMIYGSVDGSTFSSAWHEKITGSVDPIINDYGAVERAFELSSGLREIRIYAKQTYVGAGRINITLVPQTKFESVIPNQSELIKKVVDACFDLTRGNVGALVQNWPSNNTVPINFADAAVAAGTTYYPSSTGMSLAAIQNLSITGNIVVLAGNTAKLQIQVTNDEDLTAGWKTIYFPEDTGGIEVKEIIATLAPGADFAITGRKLGVYANYRLALVVTGAGGATAIIKGNSVGGA